MEEREIWVKTLNDNQLNLDLLRAYYLEDDRNLGADIFNKFFTTFLNVEYVRIQRYIMQRFNIYQVFSKTGELICFK